MHVGKMVKAVVEQSDLSAIELAKILNVERNTIYSFYRKNTLHTDVLIKLSVALQHNFFDALAGETNSLMAGDNNT